ncbi:hypothetical protein, partial [Corallococcus sp. AB049A]|uniref:hypothetical protein n=1 Tax=Corallococcus sp. AB049A TaxID=2316721 RepID=UPI001F3C3703
LAVRLSRMEEYSELRNSFPFVSKKRLAFLRQAFTLPPLNSFEATALAFFTRFERSADLRHLVAHAQMQVLPDWGVTFHDYVVAEGNVLQKRSQRYLLKDFEVLARKSASLARLGQTLINQLNATGLVPELTY